jgi:glucosamine 6-phosphate synthetase-like amidotransferase/phosphosugar isomerase protein
LIGFGENQIFVSSEILGFANYTNEYIKVDEKEIIVLHPGQSMRQSIEKRIKVFEKMDLKHNPSPPFKTFFEEEIHEQPLAI